MFGKDKDWNKKGSILEYLNKLKEEGNSHTTKYIPYNLIHRQEKKEKLDYVVNDEITKEPPVKGKDRLAVEGKKTMMVLDYLKLAFSNFSEDDQLQIDFSDIHRVTSMFVKNTASTEGVGQLELIKKLKGAIEKNRSSFIMALMDIEHKLLESLPIENQYDIQKAIEEGNSEPRYKCSNIVDIMKVYCAAPYTRPTIDNHTKKDKSGFVKLPSVTISGEAKSILESDMVEYILNEKGVDLTHKIDDAFRKQFCYKMPIKKGV